MKLLATTLVTLLGTASVFAASGNAATAEGTTATGSTTIQTSD